MALTPGDRVGPYEIVGLLGAGGMGEVYRARDSKLHRDIAIKVLRDELAADADPGSRFEREAQVLASLNHPHIAAIYGVEEIGGGRALVLELVEGPTLADRIAQGRIPIDEALGLARQIADALAAAHEHGVIHRDLKPSNIKLRGDGTVKVLDFGLAKMFADDTSRSEPRSSPTLSLAATRAGLILGTAAYMSPEQARAKPVDKRTDIWSFGCVLYEMLTGRRAFAGDEVTDTLAFVITKEADWSALPADTPAVVHRLLRRCLEKDRGQRLRDIGDAGLDLTEALEGHADGARAATRPVEARRVGRAGLALAAVFIGGAAAAGTSVYFLRPPAGATRGVKRFVMPTSASLTAPSLGGMAISPDSTTVAYVAGASQLFLRRFDQLEATPMIPMIPSVGVATAPFFSPDSRWVAFFSGGTSELKKMSLLGGPSITIASATASAPRGATWSSDDSIIFATSDTSSGLMRVSGAGGPVTVLTKADPSAGEVDHTWPQVLPGGDHVLFTVVMNGALENSEIGTLNLKTGERKVLLRGATYARYVPTGHLVYVTGNTLRAVGFDADRHEIRGEPVPVLDQVATMLGGVPLMAIASDGTLLYVPGTAAAGVARTLTWVDMQGHEEPIAAEPRPYAVPRVSPDGARIAVQVDDAANPDIVVYDTRRRTFLRMTFGKTPNIRPAWSRDGRWVYFRSDIEGAGIYRKASDGGGPIERVTPVIGDGSIHGFSPDGTVMTFSQISPSTGRDLWTTAVDGDRAPRALVVEPGDQSNAVVSPDGRWLAYHSAERGEIFVRPFPNVAAGRWQVVAAGAKWPLWSRDGKELFYVAARGMMSVGIEATQTTFQWTAERTVFPALYAAFAGLAGPRNYDLSPDGRQFLVIKEPPSHQGDSSVVVVENWFEELRQRVPVRR